MRLVGILVLCLMATGCGGGSKKTRVVRVASPAMSPTFHRGELVTVDLDAYRAAKPRRGDVVLFHPPKGAAYGHCGNPAQPADGHPCERPAGGPVYPRVFIKRVSALGGDWVEIKRGLVYLSRSAHGPFKLQDVGVRRASPVCSLCHLPKPTHVLEGSYFVTGDNRDVSDDSRNWGPVPLQWIDGKVGR
jgi:signal peptidase I